MEIRNIAIIAHVDHGKTTLVDELLKQSGAFRENQAVSERAMDSNDIERERGITILAKATSVEWGDTRINIVDTPGHADFGGEVERILSMVDGVVLLVDAAEGPMPQTKFVTSKALALGLRPIVVLNKVDKPDAEPDRALDECFDLFASLDANDDQLDFPHMYASGRNGWADHELDGPRKDLTALFDLIVKHVPAPKQQQAKNEPFRMLATTLSADPFLGRILTGRVESGSLRANETVKALSRKGDKIEQFRVSKILAFRGLGQQPIEVAEARDVERVGPLGHEHRDPDRDDGRGVGRGSQPAGRGRSRRECRRDRGTGEEHGLADDPDERPGDQHEHRHRGEQQERAEPEQKTLAREARGTPTGLRRPVRRGRQTPRRGRQR
ncbi:GTP-binding protein [Mycolicibacterium poriferae]|uniref:GTP-binding protein n=1 Tax=Mycolicibacterium poriferae TaxID=39694 RepID=UPI00321A0E0B